MIAYPLIWPVDFHVHTYFSKDCPVPPLRVIQLAYRAGLRGIAVTDHDTEEGGLAAQELNPYNDFLVIPGAEIKTDRGDLIGLYIKHPIRSRRFETVLEEIADQGGVSYVPHPLRTFKAAFPEIHREFSNIDAWEVLNGRYDAADAADATRIFADLAIRNSLSGSDAHLPWDFGTVFTLLSARPDSPAALRQALALGTVGVRIPRNEFGLAAGILCGRVTRLIKERQYGKAAASVVEVPLRVLRHAGRRIRGS
jgi:hypothetical protein